MLQVTLRKITLAAAVLPCIALLSCDDDTAPGLQGKSGSMARFALSNNHLYVVDNTSIDVFEIETGGALKKTDRVEAGIGIETIFAAEENLFLGANDAMHIYSLKDSPVPEYLSTYDHIVSCDPVVVQGNFAYVTLRISDCRNFGTEAIEIINISNLQNPLLVSSHQVYSPYGLGVDGDLLFLCKGDNGMEVFNISDPENIRSIKDYYNFHAYDVIPNEGVLVVTGNSGIYQYDYSDAQNIRELSYIPSTQ